MARKTAAVTWMSRSCRGPVYTTRRFDRFSLPDGSWQITPTGEITASLFPRGRRVGTAARPHNDTSGASRCNPRDAARWPCSSELVLWLVRGEVRSRSVRSRWHPAFRRTAACADDICIPRAGVWTEILTQLLCRWVIKCPDEGAGGIFCHVECPDVGLRIGRLRVPVPSCL